MGSRNTPATMRTKVRRSGRGSRFGPSAASRSAASRAVSPRGQLPSSAPSSSIVGKTPPGEDSYFAGKNGALMHLKEPSHLKWLGAAQQEAPIDRLERSGVHGKDRLEGGD